MIKQIVITSIGSLMLPVIALAQGVEHDITGNWQGELDAARYEPIPVVLHIQSSTEQTGELTGSLDFPSQYRTGLPIGAIRINGTNVSIMLNSVQAEFYGELTLDDNGQQVLSMQGNWSQAGEHVPLELTRQKTEETAQ